VLLDRILSLGNNCVKAISDEFKLLIADSFSMELHGIICHSAQEQADGTGADDDADGGGQSLGDQLADALGG